MIKIIENNIQLPFLIYSVKEHENIKISILESIKKMGKYSYIDDSQSMSNSDWHLKRDFYRPYYLIIQPIINNLLEKLDELFKYENKIQLGNYWFQQYEKNDFHDWHIHNFGVFSCVYYVDMPNKSSKTTFKLFDKEFEIDVKEGEILIFPSFLNHCSKPNKSNFCKTVIAFNLS